MAKDDYYVIVYKILAYLYMQLKNGENINPDFIKNDVFLFMINERYCTISDIENSQITPKGIDYLCNNSLFEKAKFFLKEIKDITPFV